MAGGEKMCTTPGWLERLCWSLCITHKYSNKVWINKGAGWAGGGHVTELFADLQARVLHTDSAETPQTLDESPDTTVRWELSLWRRWALIHRAPWVQHYQYSIHISFYILEVKISCLNFVYFWRADWCALALFTRPSKDLHWTCTGWTTWRHFWTKH